jgi:hypothetical protein
MRISKIHSQRKLVKNTPTSTSTRIITVEESADGCEVKMNGRLTDWGKTFPNSSQNFSSKPCNSLKDAEAYADELLDDSLKGGFAMAV